MPTTGPLTLTSDAFANGAAIPARFTCRGNDTSPGLAWTNAPAGANALVLVVDDTDASDFTHWIVLDLRPTEAGLPASLSPSADPPQQGRNDFGRVGYGGPCPPTGTHHYRFTLYALAAPLGLQGHPGRAAVQSALSHATVIAKVELIGTYRRS